MGSKNLIHDRLDLFYFAGLKAVLETAVRVFAKSVSWIGKQVFPTARL